MVEPIVGTIYGRLTVVSLGHMKHGAKAALVKCSCGTEKIIGYSSLKAGATRSCGCLRKEAAALRASTLNKKSI